MNGVGSPAHPPPSRTMFLAGIAGLAFQCVYLREYLTVFAGNELVVGVILAVWLASNAAGSAAGSRARAPSIGAVVAALAIAGPIGLTVIRVVRLVFAPGSLIPPAAIVPILVLSEAPAAFLLGFLFGALAKAGGRTAAVYGAENAGNIAGSIVVLAAVAAGLPAHWVCALCAVPLLLLLKPGTWPAVVALPAVLALAGGATAQWKYGGQAARIHAGRQGEIALVARGGDSTWMLNGTEYRSTIGGVALEQAVHVPMAQRDTVRRVLVICDRGYSRELARYGGVSVDIVEPEPALARGRVVAGTPESVGQGKHYDAIILGNGLPDNIATGRFYTRQFFSRMKALCAPGGVFSFSLSLSENYLSPAEEELAAALRATLGSVFRNVLVFPGEGYTFMGSDGPLTCAIAPRVPTDYLESFVLPAMRDESIASVNAPLPPDPGRRRICSVDRPAVMFMGLRRWSELSGFPTAALAAALVMLAAIAAVTLPRNRETLSVGTSGLAVGAYSVLLMLLFQADHGTLYSQVTILLASLAAGFALGSRVRRFPCGDLAIGLYAAGTLALLALWPYPPAWVFCGAHAGMGFLAGAQFVTRTRTAAGMLSAADLAGGVVGMVACSIWLAPLVGVTWTALGIGVLKAAVEAYRFPMRVISSRS